MQSITFPLVVAHSFHISHGQITGDTPSITQKSFSIIILQINGAVIDNYCNNGCVFIVHKQNSKKNQNVQHNK
jgi:hypothetical protein